MDDPNAIELDEQMPERTLLVIRLEECVVPVDVVETHAPLCRDCRWNVDQTSLTKRSTLIVIVITFSWHELTINS
jgi:hypothetical protein